MYVRFGVEITFDPVKDTANRRKHGISLARASEFDFATAEFDIDDREDYGEVRWNAIGFLDAMLYSLTFTEMEAVMRVISLRTASTIESRRYASKKF